MASALPLEVQTALPLSVSAATGSDNAAPLTPTTGGTSPGSHSTYATAPTAAAAATPAPHGYLESALSSLSAAAAGMEERFAARKREFKASLQETINSIRAHATLAPTPAPQPDNASSLEAARKAMAQRKAARIAASVTYRAPMRDAEDSLASSAACHQGPQSSAMGSEGGGGGHRGEQSLTARDSQWRSQMRRGMLRQESQFDLGVEDIDAYLDVMDEAYDEDGAAAACAADEMSPRCPVQTATTTTTIQTLTVHQDNGECEELAVVHAHVVCDDGSSVVVAQQRRSRANSLAHSANSSAIVSLHIHAESVSDTLALDDEARAAHSRNASGCTWVVSSLDPEFIVAPASPELLSVEAWHKCCGDSNHGHLVPRAPMRRCTCAVPWRSLTHLRHEHLQPLSHARNVLFEGVQYAGWRGLHYPNGEPKSIMRGVLHEVAFCLSVVYMCVLFSLVHSTTGWIAAVVHVAAKLLLYGTSSQFHRRSWLLPAYNRLKRADHSAIFILAAGSSTPGGLLLLRSDPSLGSGLFEAGIVLLCWAWSTALLGVAHSLTKRLSGRVSPFGLIWMGVSGACMFPFVYQLWQAMLPYEFAALIIAWMLYLLAVLTYSRSWFNWWPNVFSYHEFFHLFTIFGAAFTGTFNFSICLRLT